MTLDYVSRCNLGRENIFITLRNNLYIHTQKILYIIEQALSDFAETPFDPIEFPYGFLACFGRKANELKSLRSGTTNKSDLDHAV